MKSNFGDDADNVLGFLCGTCNNSEEIKQVFEELYEAMNGKPLREKDEVISAAATNKPVLLMASNSTFTCHKN